MGIRLACRLRLRLAVGGSSPLSVAPTDSRAEGSAFGCSTGDRRFAPITCCGPATAPWSVFRLATMRQRPSVSIRSSTHAPRGPGSWHRATLVKLVGSADQNDPYLPLVPRIRTTRPELGSPCIEFRRLTLGRCRTVAKRKIDQGAVAGPQHVIGAKRRSPVLQPRAEPSAREPVGAAERSLDLPTASRRRSLQARRIPLRAAGEASRRGESPNLTSDRLSQLPAPLTGSLSVRRPHAPQPSPHARRAAPCEPHRPTPRQADLPRSARKCNRTKPA